MSGNASKRNRGFTLVELLIAVTIIGILSAIAYPAYTNQVQKSNRAQAKARLVQAAQLLERFYSDNNKYYVDVSGGNLVAGTASTAAGFAKLMAAPTGTVVYSGSNNESNSPYTVALDTTVNANSFTLTATPRLQQVADTKCANLTLTNAGVKGISGTGAASDCW